jgi:hypothetical protein
VKHWRLANETMSGPIYGTSYLEPSAIVISRLSS